MKFLRLLNESVCITYGNLRLKHRPYTTLYIWVTLSPKSQMHLLNIVINHHLVIILWNIRKNWLWSGDKKKDICKITVAFRNRLWVKYIIIFSGDWNVSQLSHKNFSLRVIARYIANLNQGVFEYCVLQSTAVFGLALLTAVK